MRGSRSAHSPSDRSVGYERRSAMPHLPVHYPPTLRPFQTPFSGDSTGTDIGNALFPLSANFLSDDSRQVLSSQLQAAIAQLPTPLQQTAGFVNLPAGSLGQAASQLSTGGQSLPLPAGPVREGASQVQYHAPSVVAGWPQLALYTQ